MNQQETHRLLAQVDLGVRRGVARALLEHKRAGRNIVVWRDGEVREILPEDISVPPELPGATPPLIAPLHSG